MPLFTAHATMFGELRGFMLGGQQNVGEAFVVAQQHIVTRAQALDHIGFKQQRFTLGICGDKFHRARGGDHAANAHRIAS